MKLFCLSLSAIALVSFSVAYGQDKAVKKELAMMEGTWQLVSAEENKEAVPEFVVNNLKIVIKGDKLSLKGVEDLIQKFSKIKLKIDPATTPKTIDFVIEAGNEKGSTFEGIYEIKGDEMKICASTASGNRPGKFETKADSNRVLFVMKREKK
jgi:uncharacterized protein (TIGR03067 family)